MAVILSCKERVEIVMAKFAAQPSQVAQGVERKLITWMRLPWAANGFDSLSYCIWPTVWKSCCIRCLELTIRRIEPLPEGMSGSTQGCSVHFVCFHLQQ